MTRDPSGPWSARPSSSCGARSAPIVIVPPTEGTVSDDRVDRLLQAADIAYGRGRFSRATANEAIRWLLQDSRAAERQRGLRHAAQAIRCRRLARERAHGDRQRQRASRLRCLWRAPRTRRAARAPHVQRRACPIAESEPSPEAHAAVLPGRPSLGRALSKLRTTSAHHGHRAARARRAARAVVLRAGLGPFVGAKSRAFRMCGETIRWKLQCNVMRIGCRGNQSRRENSLCLVCDHERHGRERAALHAGAPVSNLRRVRQLAAWTRVPLLRVPVR